MRAPPPPARVSPPARPRSGPLIRHTGRVSQLSLVHPISCVPGMSSPSSGARGGHAARKRLPPPAAPFPPHQPRTPCRTVLSARYLTCCPPLLVSSPASPPTHTPAHTPFDSQSHHPSSAALLPPRTFSARRCSEIYAHPYDTYDPTCTPRCARSSASCWSASCWSLRSSGPGDMRRRQEHTYVDRCSCSEVAPVAHHTGAALALAQRA